MVPTELEKVFNNILSSRMDKGDKKFILTHSFNIIELFGAACGDIATDEKIILAESRNTGTFTQARIEHGENVKGTIAQTIALIKEHLINQASEHGIDLVEHDPASQRVDKVILTDKDPLKGVCLTLQSEKVQLIEEFKFLCIENLPAQLSIFHQANCRNFQKFEAWKPNTYIMDYLGKIIAKQLNIPFINELTIEIDPSDAEKIILPDFVPFKTDVHTFEDFYG